LPTCQDDLHKINLRALASKNAFEIDSYWLYYFEYSEYLFGQDEVLCNVISHERSYVGMLLISVWADGLLLDDFVLKFMISRKGSRDLAHGDTLIGLIFVGLRFILNLNI
jgi:hypothetical protein